MLINIITLKPCVNRAHGKKAIGTATVRTFQRVKLTGLTFKFQFDGAYQLRHETKKKKNELKKSNYIPFYCAFGFSFHPTHDPENVFEWNF